MARKSQEELYAQGVYVDPNTMDFLPKSYQSRAVKPPYVTDYGNWIEGLNYGDWIRQLNSEIPNQREVMPPGTTVDYAKQLRDDAIRSRERAAAELLRKSKEQGIPYIAPPPARANYYVQTGDLEGRRTLIPVNEYTEAPTAQYRRYVKGQDGTYKAVESIPPVWEETSNRPSFYPRVQVLNAPADSDYWTTQVPAFNRAFTNVGTPESRMGVGDYLKRQSNPYRDSQGNVVKSIETDPQRLITYLEDIARQDAASAKPTRNAEVALNIANAYLDARQKAMDENLPPEQREFFKGKAKDLTEEANQFIFATYKKGAKQVAQDALEAQGIGRHHATSLTPLQSDAMPRVIPSVSDGKVLSDRVDQFMGYEADNKAGLEVNRALGMFNNPNAKQFAAIDLSDPTKVDSLVKSIQYSNAGLKQGQIGDSWDYPYKEDLGYDNWYGQVKEFDYDRERGGTITYTETPYRELHINQLAREGGYDAGDYGSNGMNGIADLPLNQQIQVANIPGRSRYNNSVVQMIDGKPVAVPVEAVLGVQVTDPTRYKQIESDIAKQQGNVGFLNNDTRLDQEGYTLVVPSGGNQYEFANEYAPELWEEGSPVPAALHDRRVVPRYGVLVAPDGTRTQLTGPLNSIKRDEVADALVAKDIALGKKIKEALPYSRMGLTYEGTAPTFRVPANKQIGNAIEKQGLFTEGAMSLLPQPGIDINQPFSYQELQFNPEAAERILGEEPSLSEITKLRQGDSGKLTTNDMAAAQVVVAGRPLAESIEIDENVPLGSYGFRDADGRVVSANAPGARPAAIVATTGGVEALDELRQRKNTWDAVVSNLSQLNKTLAQPVSGAQTQLEAASQGIVPGVNPVTDVVYGGMFPGAAQESPTGFKYGGFRFQTENAVANRYDNALHEMRPGQYRLGNVYMENGNTLYYSPTSLQDFEDKVSEGRIDPEKAANKLKAGFRAELGLYPPLIEYGSNVDPNWDAQTAYNNEYLARLPMSQQLEMAQLQQAKAQRELEDYVKMQQFYGTMTPLKSGKADLTNALRSREYAQMKDANEVEIEDPEAMGLKISTALEEARDKRAFDNEIARRKMESAWDNFYSQNNVEDNLPTIFTRASKGESLTPVESQLTGLAKAQNELDYWANLQMQRNAEPTVYKPQSHRNIEAAYNQALTNYETELENTKKKWMSANEAKIRLARTGGVSPDNPNYDELMQLRNDTMRVSDAARDVIAEGLGQVTSQSGKRPNIISVGGKSIEPLPSGVLDEAALPAELSRGTASVSAPSLSAFVNEQTQNFPSITPGGALVRVTPSKPTLSVEDFNRQMGPTGEVPNTPPLHSLNPSRMPSMGVSVTGNIPDDVPNNVIDDVADTTGLGSRTRAFLKDYGKLAAIGASAVGAGALGYGLYNSMRPKREEEDRVPVRSRW